MNSLSSTSEVPSPDELPPCLVVFFEKFQKQAAFLPIVLDEIIASLTGQSRQNLDSWDLLSVNHLKNIFHPEDYRAFLEHIGLVVENEVKFKLADGIEVEEAVTRLQKIKNLVVGKMGTGD